MIQPDLCHCGGLWEAKKIAAMAETYYKEVMHSPAVRAHDGAILDR